MKQVIITCILLTVNFSSSLLQGATFDLTVQITESPDGILHIHLDPDGDVPSFDGCGGQEDDGMKLTLLFNFYDEFNNLIHTVDLKQSDGNPILFDNLSNQSPKNYWFPKNLVYDYFIYLPPSNVLDENGAITTCNSGIPNIDNITNVEIITSLNIIPCPAWQSISTNGVSLSLNYLGESLSSFNCESSSNPQECINITSEHDFNVPTNTGTNLPVGYIDFGVEFFEVIADCEVNQSACPENTNGVWVTYAIPYGGCPEYSQNWTYEDGNSTYTACHFAANEFDSSQVADPDNPTTFEDTYAVSPDYPYFITITDAIGNQIQETLNAEAIESDLIDKVEKIDEFHDECDSWVIIEISPQDVVLNNQNSEYDISISGPGIASIQNGNRYKRKIQENGTYIISITNKFSGCGEEVEIEITEIKEILDLPVVDVGSDLFFCEGGTVPTIIVDADSEGLNDSNVTYEWLITSRTYRVQTGECKGSTTVEIIEGGTDSQLVLSSENILLNRCYIVEVIATNQDGCIQHFSNNDTKSIIYAESPPAEISPPVIDVDACNGEMAILTANEPPFEFITYSYKWSNGVKHIDTHVHQSGIYTVTVTSDVTGCSATDKINVSINGPTAYIAGTEILCGDEITLELMGYATEYYWSTGEQTPIITVSQGGLYTVTVTADNCYLISTVEVIDSNFSLDFGFDLMEVDACEEDYPVILQPIGHPQDFFTYSWSSGENTNSIEVGAPGQYTLNAYSPNGCVNQKTITVNLLVGPMVSLGNTKSICEEESIILDAGTSANTYLWSNGSQQQTIEVNSEGIYSVTVTKDGCDRTDEVEVMHYEAPFADLGGVLSICNGEPILVDAFHPDAVHYKWSNEPFTSSESAKYISIPGDYSVTITNSQGCSSVSEINIISGNPFIDLEVQVQDCNSWETILSTIDFADFDYLWTDKNGVILSDKNTLTITTLGEYNLYVSQNGCTVTQQIVFDNESFGAVSAYTIGANGNPIEETWTTTKNIDGMMTVASGTKLTIDGAIVHFMDEQSGITVAEGGFLEIINGAILKGNPCNAEYWYGVEVAGNTNIAHDEDFLVNGNPNHGAVLINSGSIIQDAITGIQTINGIIQADGANFIDNELGIKIGIAGETIFFNQVGAGSANIIENNNFGIESPINSSLKFMGIEVYNYFHSIKFIGNHFYNMNPVQHNVLGISVVNSNCYMHHNIFDDLRMGISIFDLVNVYFSNIVNYNLFNNTEKGLLMVFGLVPQANHNNFDNIPNGIHSTDTYGIYSINSRFIINKNDFQTSVNNNEIKGLVTSHTWDNFVHINENTFDGAFGAATQFQATNNNVLLECNAYSNAPKIDWYIAENGLLNQQGDCQGIFLPAYATNNTWHSESTGYHIYKASSGNFFIDHDPCSEPTLFSSNVTKKNCGYVSETDCCILVETIEDTPDDRVTLSQDLYQLLEQGNQQGFINLLNQQQAEWADKLLVRAYLGWNDKSNASLVLNRIPQNNPENIAFKDVFTALINANPQISAIDEVMIRAYAQSTDLAIQSLAHTVLASYFGEIFDYDTAPVVISSNKKETTRFDETRTFDLIPNPSSYQLLVQLNQPISDEKVVFTIYDLTGKMMKTVNLAQQKEAIDIADLAVGVYYCQINLNGKPSKIQKLAIVR